MSSETLQWLNQNTLIGYAAERGTAWHYRRSEQGEQPNHYDGPVPVEAVRDRLFHWQAASGPLSTTVLTADGVLTVTDPDRKVIIRPDTQTVLGVFKKGYEIHQFDEWLLDNVAPLLDDDLNIGSAGLLKNGAVAWVSVEVPDSITTPSGVEFRPYLLATTSHDGSLMSTFKPVVQNVVCDNTHEIALAEAGPKLKIKHTKNSAFQVATAQQALGIVHTVGEEFAAEVERLTNMPVTNGQFDLFLNELAPIPEAGRGKALAERKQDTLRKLYTSDERVAPWAGTAWGVVQAVNTASHHSFDIRGTERAERNMLRAATGETGQVDRDTLKLLATVTA